MCWQPITLRNQTTWKTINGRKQEVSQNVPCGKCQQCLKAKLSAWLFRLDKELEVAKNPLFITLTYDNTNLPLTKNGLVTLRKSDVQNFFKRFRKEYCKKIGNGTSGLRYYLCGEYGSKFGRPHYHMILLNCLHPDIIHKNWQNGHVLTLPLKSGGTYYVLKYLAKKDSKLKEGQQKLFSLVSGGFGKNYLTDAIKQYHNASIENSHLTMRGGQKVPIPKYYKDHIYNDEMRRKVSQYMEKLSLDLEIKRFTDYKHKYPQLSDENIVKNLQLTKFNINIAHRINETF